MKKIVFVFLMVIVFGGLHVSAQQNITVVDVGGVNINIPTPSKEYIEVGNNLRDTLSSIVRDTDKLLCFYVESPEYKKYVNNSHDSLNMDKYIFIYSSIQSIRNDFSENRILMFNKNIIETNISVVKNGVDSLNKILVDSNLLVSYNNYNSIHTKGIFYHIKDAGGEFKYAIENRFSKNYKSLSTFNSIIVKKKLLYFEVYCEYKDYESIKWITETSESWAKAILDANK